MSRVIDADGHVWEPESVWEKHLDAAFQDRRPRLVRDNRGTTRYVYEGKLIPPGEGLGAWAPEGILEATTHRDGAFDPKLRLVDMDTEGIDVAVLFGSFGLVLNHTRDAALSAALCRAYNDWLADYCSADSSRLKAVPAIPLVDMPRALAEARRAIGELGMVGINLSTTMLSLPAHDEAFHPLYALAQELGVPITFHAGGGGFVEPRLDNYALSHTCAFPFDVMYGMTCVLGGGVMERFPELRVAFLEAGCGFLPYYLERLDEHFHKRTGEMPIPRPPSEYLAQGRVWVSCEPDESSLEWVVSRVGAERILYASDYPHWDAEFPESVRKIRDREGLGAEAKRAILGDNAAELFGLDG